MVNLSLPVTPAPFYFQAESLTETEVSKIKSKTAKLILLTFFKNMYLFLVTTINLGGACTCESQKANLWGLILSPSMWAHGIELKVQQRLPGSGLGH